jgi:LmbE family N-acetylglucosaminyl deacetylase
MSLTKAVIRFAAPVPKVESFERYLFIGPHPDDIEVGAGATAAKLAAEGKEICFLICTDGRYGDEYAPKGITENGLAELRKKEALDSAKLLGVTDVRFLGLSDGGFYSEEELYLTLRAREYGIRHLCSAAEGFRVLGVTQMHCLPEGE